MNLQEMIQTRKEVQNQAETLVSVSEQGKRSMSHAETLQYNALMAEHRALSTAISEREKLNTIRSLSPLETLVGEGGPQSKALAGNAGRMFMPKAFLSHDYVNDFHTWLRSGGDKMGAALYEGSLPAGGYAVPLEVAGQVVPLAATDRGVREVATVIPTAMDIKVPRQTAFSSATAKAEGTGNGSNLFTESEPTLDQFTLSAFMAGLTHLISWELAEDVPSFQAFAVNDMLLAQSIFEENLFVNGTGTNQAQGLIGNTGAGITGVTAGTDNYASELLDATFDVMGTLKTAYHNNASWLMSRSTSISLRKAQKQANLFEPVFTTSGGKDYLHGRPVVYSTAMPAIAASATPILFGDFAQGYVIGDRGGAGINVKILDQPRATEGLIVLLAYRRTDGRVRRSEAIQAITLHS